MYKGVIFDFNGTLFWDTHLHNEAWDKFLQKFGIRLSDEEKHLKLHGKNNVQLIQDLFDVDLTMEAILDIAREKELIYQELVKRDKLRLAEGVVELLDELKSSGIAFTIVTASDKLNVDFFIDYLMLDKWFDPDKIVFADGKQRPKPFPDMYFKAMDLLDIRPSESVILEDSETGLLAAREANPGKVIIVNSNNADYSNWNFEVIKTFIGFDSSKILA